MKSIGILASTLAGTLACFSAGAVAQTVPADADAQARVAQQNAITDRYLTTVRVAMAGKVDTKDAAAGQEVSARTLAEVRLADGTTLPKGTRLVGHVMQVKAGGMQEGVAVLALVFDRAELKGSQTVALRSVIRGVTPAGNVAASEDTFPAPMAPMSGTGGAGVGAPGRTVTRGGISLPGANGTSRGGTAGANVPSIEDPMGGTAAGAGGTLPSMGDPVGSSTGGVAANTRSLEGTTSATADRRVVDAGERTSPAPRATAMPGVMLSNTAVANASGTLTAFGRNISLEIGTQITLGVITR